MFYKPESCAELGTTKASMNRTRMHQLVERRIIMPIKNFINVKLRPTYAHRLWSSQE